MVVARRRAPLAVAGAALVAVVTVGVRDPHAAGNYPTCPSIALFGVHCPGCGSMRAMHELAAWRHRRRSLAQHPRPDRAAAARLGVGVVVRSSSRPRTGAGVASSGVGALRLDRGVGALRRSAQPARVAVLRPRTLTFSQRVGAMCAADPFWFGGSPRRLRGFAHARLQQHLHRRRLGALRRRRHDRGHQRRNRAGHGLDPRRHGERRRQSGRCRQGRVRHLVGHSGRGAPEVPRPTERGAPGSFGRHRLHDCR